jgi:hypothetical protein
LRVDGQTGTDLLGFLDAILADGSADGGPITGIAQPEGVDETGSHDQTAAKKNASTTRHGHHHE